MVIGKYLKNFAGSVAIASTFIVASQLENIATADPMIARPKLSVTQSNKVNPINGKVDKYDIITIQTTPKTTNYLQGRTYLDESPNEGHHWVDIGNGVAGTNGVIKFEILSSKNPSQYYRSLVK